MSDERTAQERLHALEELTAHQSKAIEELSSEMAVQGEMLRRMQKKLDAMAERFMALEETVTPPAESTRPPHW
ncbi:MAG TPA: SlyX family protein [Rhizobiaceae bacterium]|nr:SlyX family protein [Rhizobiaceae bacterium]